MSARVQPAPQGLLWLILDPEDIEKARSLGLPSEARNLLPTEEARGVFFALTGRRGIVPLGAHKEELHSSGFWMLPPNFNPAMTSEEEKDVC